MGLPEELWSAMHGAATAARHEKHPSMLRGLGKMADCSLESWRAASTSRFSRLTRTMKRKVYHMSAYARAYRSPSADKLFPLTVAAVLELYELLDYISSLDPTGQPTNC